MRSLVLATIDNPWTAVLVVFVLAWVMFRLERRVTRRRVFFADVDGLVAKRLVEIDRQLRAVCSHGVRLDMRCAACWRGGFGEGPRVDVAPKANRRQIKL